MNKRFYATATMAMILATVFGGRISHTENQHHLPARAADTVQAQPEKTLPSPGIASYPLRVRKSQPSASDG